MKEDCCLCRSWARMVATLFRPCRQLLLRLKNPSAVIINQMPPKLHVKHCLCYTWTQLIFWCVSYHWSKIMPVEKCSIYKVFKYGTVDFLFNGFFLLKKKPEIIQTTKYTSIAHFWCPLEQCYWTSPIDGYLSSSSSVSLKGVISWPFLATDSLFSKQVRDNKQNKFWDF